MAYQSEKSIALKAVQRACRLTESVFDDLIRKKQPSGDGASIAKEDKSPVTVADFGAQAIINAILGQQFPNDPIVGEEDSEALKSNDKMRADVWRLVQRTLQESPEAPLGMLSSDDEMLQSIDRGNYSGGNKGRMWALDPIDGTKGFLRGGQYAVCLALIRDGKVVLGVIGCPNLPVDYTSEDSPKGMMMWASEGEGAYESAIHDTTKAKKVSMSSETDPAKLRFCESVEAGHSNQEVTANIAKHLGIIRPPTRMDSQAKYVSIARGDGDIYLRLPTSATYEEKIWDHASGNIIVAEAGGKVSDIHGNDLNFGVGRTLKENKGIVAAPKALHAKAIEAVRASL